MWYVPQGPQHQAKFSVEAFWPKRRASDVLHSKEPNITLSVRMEQQMILDTRFQFASNEQHGQSGRDGKAIVGLEQSRNAWIGLIG